MGRRVRDIEGGRRESHTLAAGVVYGLGTALAILSVLFGMDALLGSDPTLGDAVTLAFVPVLFDLVVLPVKPFAVALAHGQELSRADGTRGSLGSALRGATGRYRSLLGTHLFARVAGGGYSLLLAPVVIAAALVAGTAVSLALYGLDLVRTPEVDYYVLALYGLAYTVWMVGILPPAFAHQFALAGERPRWAWLASAGALCENPRVAARYAVARFALGMTPLVVAVVVAVVVPAEGRAALLAFLVALVVAAVVTRTVQLRYQRATYERIEPSGQVTANRLRDALPGIRPTTRTVAIAVLVVGLVAGSAAIRVTDARPNAEAVPGTVDTDDPRELYAVARARSVGVSHNATFEMHGGNWSQRPEPAYRHRWVVEYPDRQIELIRWPADGATWGRPETTYADDGLRIARRPTRVDYVIAGGRVDGRTVLATPYYPQLLVGSSFGAVPRPDADWERLSRRDGSIVLETTDARAVAEWAGRDSDHFVHNETTMRVRIASDEQRIEQVTVRHRFVRYMDEARTEIAGRRDTRYEVTFDYEDVEVRRPGGIGFRPGGFLWDLAYY